MAKLTPPIGTDIRERSARSSATWTPTHVKSAYLAAEAGQLMRLADLVDATLEDDRISGTLGTRTRGLLGLPLTWALEPDRDDVKAAIDKDFWRAMPESTLGDHLAWGIMLGVSLAELQWARNEDGRVVPHLKVWHPRWLKYEHDTDRWILSTENQGDIEIRRDDPRWWLYTPYGSDRPWRRAAVRSVALWWLLKRYAVQDWGTYGEAHGNPTRVAMSPMGANAKDRQEVAADLQDISGRTGMALPEGWSVNLLEATARTWETFEKQITTANAGIAVVILGQTLTTEVQGGSLAAAQVHDVVRHDLIRSDEQVLSTSIHDTPLAWWAAFNYGLPEAAAPWARWDTTPPSDAKSVAETNRAKAEALEAAARAVLAWHSLGIPLDLEQLALEHGVPLKDLQAATHALSTAQPPARSSVRLASGDPPLVAPGFLRGQLYVDGLARRLDTLAPLKSSLAKLTAFIEAATSFEEIQAGLPALFEQLDPDDVRGVLEALMLADLAGQFAVAQDL